jgi:uncharacterized membrane protein
MKASTMKGMFHLLLTLATGAEVATSKTKTRTLLLGACIGWHAYATYWHFIKEQE